MSVVRYEPWGLLDQLHGEIDRLFDNRLPKHAEDHDRRAAGDWVPAVDIREEEDRFVIHADVPGVNPKDIEVKLENGVLSIKGERQTGTRDEGKAYKRVERVRGSFYRRFSLPDSADADAISAKSGDGVLEITVPKQAKVLPKRIAVAS